MDFLKKFCVDFGNQLFKYRNINLFDLMFWWVYVTAFIPVLNSFGWGLWINIPIVIVIVVFHHYNSWYGHKFFATE